MPRAVVVALIWWFALLPAAAASAPSATPDDLDAAATFAVELSRLEQQRDWWTLASLMHPDSAAIVPESAVAGWYEAEFAGKETAELTVLAVVPEPWTWPVSGRTYQQSVTVSYLQPYWVDGVRSDIPGEVHLVHDGERWGWFFGASRDFVHLQISQYSPGFLPSGIGGLVDPGALNDPDRIARFPDPLLAELDAWWSGQFAAAGRTYHPPAAVVPFSGVLDTGCGPVDATVETAFYCVLDGSIYYSEDFRRTVIESIGDFGWSVVIAHEWGHHIQALAGVDFGRRSSDPGSASSRRLESQADCLAGAYTDVAEFNGWLEPGDVDEALLITSLSGDLPGESGDAATHGASEDRLRAFGRGYHNGLSACGLGL
ncbi:MAG: neutral zinc metallopeptidase [Chloroflexota bacterium]